MYYKIHIVLLLILLISSCNNEEIPNIYIIKDSKIGWDEKEPCNIVYSYNDKIDTLSAAIKCRGGMSSRYFKHSYSLELDSDFSFKELPNDDDWILNANYIDKTFMRHKISYDLFREMDKKNIAAQSYYINVFLNNKYDGLYLIMEKINGKMIKLDKNDSLAMLFKDPPIFVKEKLDYAQDSTNYYQQKYPKKHISDKTNYIEKFKDFIFNSTDENFDANINKWIDIDNVVDWHILLLFSNNSDGIMKNFYLYKLDSKTPFRFAIWDYDHSFGRDGDNELNIMYNELDCNRSVLIKRLQ